MGPAPLLLFAHGAGAGSSHPWNLAWRARLAGIGVVRAFDYPYVREGRRLPDRHEKLLAAHRAALVDARAGHGATAPVVLVGKSMGSRISCHLASEEPGAAVALVCLGYPLVSPGKKRKLRGEVLKALRSPILFVQGTRDRLCPLDTLAAVRAEMSAPNELHVVETGDHSLLTTRTYQRTRGVTQEDTDRTILAAIAAFVARHATLAP